jgi:hypothetical protein
MVASSSTSAQTSVTDPLTVASSLGISSSGWLKVGELAWRGHVVIDGSELEIEQLASSWRCVTDGTSRATLKGLLEALLKTGRRSDRSTPQ